MTRCLILRCSRKKLAGTDLRLVIAQFGELLYRVTGTFLYENWNGAADECHVSVKCLENLLTHPPARAFATGRARRVLEETSVDVRHQGVT